MGLGDEIIAAGQAERLFRETGRQVAILDRHGRPRKHDLWQGNPAISPKGPERIVNGPGCRPYIRYPFTREKGHFYTDWRVRDHRGSIHLTEAEELFASHYAGLIVINPTIKAKANPNKDWGFERYQAVVDAMPDIRFVQLGDGPHLSGVGHVETPTFRMACAVLSRARLYVGAEGAMHHASAAFRIPAVVIFGSAVSVVNMGYLDHVNLSSGEVCGSWQPCEHCRENMDAITVDQVVAAIRGLL